MSEILFARLDEIVLSVGGTFTNGILANPNITNPTFVGAILANYQAANVANAALYFSVPNRTLGLLPTYNGFVFAQGNAISATNQGGQNQSGLQQALVGTISLAAGEIKAGIAVAGYAEANSADPANAIAIFGQAQANVAGGSIFAGNFIVQNIADSAAHGLNTNYMAGLEINPNKWKNIGGTDTTVNGNHFYGIVIQGGGNHTDEIGSAIVINNSAFPATTRWANGVEFSPGSSIVALKLGPVALGSSQSSQSIILTGTDAGSVARNFAIVADPNGSGYFSPAVNGQIIFLDGSGLVLLETQAISVVGGNTGVIFPQLASAGVITNSATGVLSSTAKSGTGSIAGVISPSFTTPFLGAATASTINGNSFTTGAYTLTGGAGKTLTFNNALTLAGTDGTTLTFPTTNATIARTDAAQTFTGVQTFSSTIIGSINGNAATVTTNANLTGDVTSSGNVTTLTNASVIAKVLTGYAAGAGTLAATDSILQAFQKVGGLVDNAAWPTYTPTITSQTGTPTTVTATGRYKQIGKKVTAVVQISVIAAGTATGFMVASVPVTAHASALGGGTAYESSATGNGGITALTGGISTTTFRIINVSGATFWISGYVVQVIINYEAA